MVAAATAVVGSASTNVRHRIRLAFPGPSFNFGAVMGIMRASDLHETQIVNSGNGWDDFNALWAQALNAYEAGECTHFAMLHSDIAPDPGWLDTLLDELEATGAALVSVPAAIKDQRGLSSTGIGNPVDKWNPLRRFTMRELLSFPETFRVEDTGYPGGILLHNTGCWVCDLRDARFRLADEHGNLKCFFDFPRRVFRDPATGKWTNNCESEDWYFSRQLYELGVPSCVTRKVGLTHRGIIDYPNNQPWGMYDHDEDTRHKWDAK